MRVFKVNLSQSYESFKVHGKITCPIEGHPGYVQMSKISKGDLIILMNGISSIFGFAIARDNVFAGNVSYYGMKPELTMNELFTLDASIIYEFKRPADALVASDLLSQINDNPLASKNFCLECHVKENFIKEVNDLIVID